MKKIVKWIIFMGLSMGLTACSKQKEDVSGAAEGMNGTIVQVEEKEEIVADYTENMEEISFSYDAQRDIAVMTGAASKDVKQDGYEELLNLYYQALCEQQTSQEQELNHYSEDYALLYSIVSPYWAWEDSENILSKEGYAYVDLNEDGVEELLLGWVDNEFWNMDEGYVFAVYTLVDGEAVLAIEGWERCLYVVGEDGYLYQSGSYSVWENYYTKGKFNPEYEGYLEPVEELYSHMGTTKKQEWKYMQNASENEAVPMERDAALELGENWMNNGKKLEYTLFSEYRQVEDSNIH